MVPGETPAQEAPGTGRHGTPSRLSAKRLSSQNGKSSRSDGCCEFHFRPVAVAARLLVVDAQVLLRVSRALLVGQQETSGSAVMGFAASCFHAWSLTSVELVQWLLPWRRRVSRARVCCVIAVSCLSLRCRDASRIGNQRGRHGVLSWWECLGGLGVRTARFSSNRSKFVVASGEMKTNQTFTLLGRLTWPAVGCDSRAADRDTCRVKWHYHAHFV